MKILVTGGAGYIGSHMVRLLCEQGIATTVLDDLSTGFADAIDPRATFIQGDIADRALLARVLPGHDAVIHFASRIAAGESVQKPGEYYRINVANTIGLLEAMAECGVGRFVFSSSAGVYGEPLGHAVGGRMDESHPKNPVSPYARSKWLVEQMLPDFATANGTRWAALRYFNAAGAHPDGSLGERHDPETHLIPIALEVAAGKRAQLTLFGGDYPTPDGSCIRDYVHICDLADAHLAALRYLGDGGQSRAFNLGIGQGYSNRQVVEAVEAATGRKVALVLGPRRPGDPAQLVADATSAEAALAWQPQYPQLSTMVEHAWQFMQRRH
jgi:UDP-glucose 4-epimerase